MLFVTTVLLDPWIEMAKGPATVRGLLSMRTGPGAPITWMSPMLPSTVIVLPVIVSPLMTFDSIEMPQLLDVWMVFPLTVIEEKSLVRSAGHASGRFLGRSDVRSLDDSEKGRIAKAAFAYVAELLPPNSPYRRELQRYVDEAVPGTVGNVAPPFPPIEAGICSGTS